MILWQNTTNTLDRSAVPFRMSIYYIVTVCRSYTHKYCEHKGQRSIPELCVIAQTFKRSVVFCRCRADLDCACAAAAAGFRHGHGDSAPVRGRSHSALCRLAARCAELWDSPRRNSFSSSGIFLKIVAPAVGPQMLKYVSQENCKIS